MNPRQKEYFRNLLLGWRRDLLKEGGTTLRHLQNSEKRASDPMDQASNETERTIELRTRDRERKLIAKIDKALQRIENGTYGYCERTGKSISLKRLKARPIATLSIEAQEQHESSEKKSIKSA